MHIAYVEFSPGASFSKSAISGESNSLGFDFRIIQQPFGQSIHTLSQPVTGKSHECHLLFFARLKADCRAGWNGKPETEGLLAVKLERAVRLEEMAV
jgi:hypothetical protein